MFGKFCRAKDPAHNRSQPIAQIHSAHGGQPAQAPVAAVDEQVVRSIPTTIETIPLLGFGD